MRRPLRIVVALTLLAAAALPGDAARAAIVQQGPKLVPLYATPTGFFGHSVALSADGRTALVGAFGDAGAAWVLTRGDDGSWSEQGPPLQPLDYGGSGGWLGWSVALSADGDTALVGAPLDGGTAGGAWVFTRSNGVWSQDGGRLAPTDATPNASQLTLGMSVALSADGGTALVGAQGDALGAGAAWVFVRGADGWTQQGPKLRPSGETGSDGINNFGSSAALSADGSTALVGAQYAFGSSGSAWAFHRSDGAWTQEGPQLTADDEVGHAGFGGAVALSGDGDTALVGAFADDDARGAAWTFTRSGGIWSRWGPKLVGSGTQPPSQFGASVALGAGGDVALVGGVSQGPNGAAWLYRRGDAGWDEQAVLTPSDGGTVAHFGAAVALTPDASTLFVGGSGDDSGRGAAWSFGAAVRPLVVPRMTVRSFAAGIGPFDLSAALADGDAPTGTITFRLFGPYPWGCTGPASSVTLPVTGNGTYETSALVSNAFGTYRVLTTYSGDARNAPLASWCGQQDFDITDRGTAKLHVEARGSRAVGAPLTLVSSFDPGVAASGDVVVSLFGPSDPACERAPLVSERVTAVDGRIPAITYVPTTTGRHTVTLQYAGDELHYPSELFCGDATVAIERAQPAIAASTSAPVGVGDPIGAAARVDGFHPGGAVTFLLYGPGDPICAGRPLAAAGSPLVDGVAQSQAVATRATGTYHVTASYDGDRRNAPVESACATGAVVVRKRRPTLDVGAATPMRGALSDDATLRGAFRPSGNVRFSLYGRRDPHCRRRPVFTVLAPLDGDGHATTTPLGADSGRYQFVVRYGGDADNEAVATPCGANPVRVLRRHAPRRRHPGRHGSRGVRRR
jgi:hypothetical protein